MITASVVTYNTKEADLDKLIKCVERSTIDLLYIIDHSPVDSISSKYSSQSIKYIKHDNLGYGSGHNVAIRESLQIKADYHVVLNPDIYWEGDVIKVLSDYMDQNPMVAQVMPKVHLPNGELQYVCNLCPSPFDLIFKRFLPASLTRKRLEKFQLRFSGYDKPMNVPYLYGCFMFFRVSAFKDVGLFDERFFMYPEDIDITRRMHAKYKTMFYPEASITHVHAAESRTNKRMLKIHIKNMIKYFNKWGWLIDRQRRQFNKQLLKELNWAEL